jgi:Tol biopolymer transport system component
MLILCGSPQNAPCCTLSRRGKGNQVARIFISYSRKDETFARRLARSLSDLGADIWIDVEDIPAGMKWSSAIQQGLTVSDVLLVLLSPDAMRSSNVEDEWQYFLDKRKPIIPVLARPTDNIHFQLNRLQYIDFYRQPYDAALVQLHEELARKGARLDPIIPPASVQPAFSHAPASEGAEPLSPPKPASRLPLALVGVGILVVLAALALIIAPRLSGDNTLTLTLNAQNTRIAQLEQATEIILTAQAVTGATGIPGATTVPTTPPSTATNRPAATNTIAPSATRPAPTDVPATNTPPAVPTAAKPAPKIAFVSNRDGNKEIYLMNPDGSSQQRITNNPAVDDDPAWSPDGRKLVFASNRDGKFNLYSMNRDGTGLTQLTSGDDHDHANPAWSPDGQRIAFTNNQNGNWDLYLMDVDGGNIQQLTSEAANELAPSWSPDGKTLAFQSDHHGTPQIFLLNLEDESVSAVTDEPGKYNQAPAWAPDSSRVAFSSDRGGNFNLYAIDPVVGVNTFEIITDSGGYHGSPTWSPDSQRVAYDWNTRPNQGGNWDIYVTSALSGDETNLTNNPADDTNPAWSP